MYELTEAAAGDIEAIFEDSVERFGFARTEAYVGSLQRCLTLLGTNPEMGVAADDIRHGYRRFPHESHVIFYKATRTGIIVVRVLHQHMKAVRELFEPAWSSVYAAYKPLSHRIA